MTVLCVLLYSCTKDEELMPNNSSKYLNIEIPENHNFSDNQKELLCVAFERVGQFVQIDKTGALMLIGSAQDANMSEELYSYIKERIEIANKQRQLNIQLVEAGVITNDLYGINYIPRTKSASSETSTNSGVGWSSSTTILSHDDAIKLMNGMQTTHPWAGLATILTSFAAPVQSAIAGAYCGLQSLHWGNIENNYLSGSQQGIRITYMTYSTSYGPVTDTIVENL